MKVYDEYGPPVYDAAVATAARVETSLNGLKTTTTATVAVAPTVSRSITVSSEDAEGEARMCHGEEVCTPAQQKKCIQKIKHMSAGMWGMDLAALVLWVVLMPMGRGQLHCGSPLRLVIAWLILVLVCWGS